MILCIGVAVPAFYCAITADEPGGRAIALIIYIMAIVIGWAIEATYVRRKRVIRHGCR